MSASDLDFLTVMDGDEDWENFSPVLMGCDFTDEKCDDVDGLDDSATMGCLKEADLINSEDLFLAAATEGIIEGDNVTKDTLLKLEMEQQQPEQQQQQVQQEQQQQLSSNDGTSISSTEELEFVEAHSKLSRVLIPNVQISLMT